MGDRSGLAYAKRGRVKDNGEAPSRSSRAPPVPSATGALLPGVQPVQAPRPIEHALVGGNKMMPLERRGDDEPVGGVAVHVRQKAGAGRDCAIDGYLDQPLFQQVPAPSIRVKAEIEPALLDSHTDFPEGYGRNRSIAFLERALERAAGLRP